IGFPLEKIGLDRPDATAPIGFGEIERYLVLDPGPPAKVATVARANVDQGLRVGADCTNHVVDISEIAGVFARGKGIDRQASYCARILVEWMPNRASASSAALCGLRCFSTLSTMLAPRELLFCI